MPRKLIFIIIFFILYFLFFPPIGGFSVSAQKIESVQINDLQSDQNQTQGQVLGLFDGLLKKKVPEEVKKYNEASLPPIGLESANLPVSAITPGVQTSNVLGEEVGEHSAADSAFQYYVAKSVPGPEEAVTNPESFFARLLASIIDWFENLFSFGNEDAEKFAKSDIPSQAADEVLARSGSNKQYAQAPQFMNVLGSQTSQKAMERALDLVRCANLPAGVGDCLESGQIEDLDVTPAPDSGSTIPLPSSVALRQPDKYLFPDSSLICVNNLPASGNLIEKIREAAYWKNIPVSFVASIACIEGAVSWTYSTSEVEQYSKEGGVVPNCSPNSAGAKGPMQFVGGTWDDHKIGAIQGLGRTDVNACNISDAYFAAVHKFDQDRNQKELLGRDDYVGAAANPYCKAATDDWFDPNLICCVASRFYGSFRSCTIDPATGDYDSADCRRFNRLFGEPMNYCQFTERFMKQWKEIYN